MTQKTVDQIMQKNIYKRKNTTVGLHYYCEDDNSDMVEDD